MEGGGKKETAKKKKEKKKMSNLDRNLEIQKSLQELDLQNNVPNTTTTTTTTPPKVLPLETSERGKRRRMEEGTKKRTPVETVPPPSSALTTIRSIIGSRTFLVSASFVIVFLLLIFLRPEYVIDKTKLSIKTQKGENEENSLSTVNYFRVTVISFVAAALVFFIPMFICMPKDRTIF